MKIMFAAIGLMALAACGPAPGQSLSDFVPEANQPLVDLEASPSKTGEPDDDETVASSSTTVGVATTTLATISVPTTNPPTESSVEIPDEVVADLDGALADLESILVDLEAGMAEMESAFSEGEY